MIVNLFLFHNLVHLYLSKKYFFIYLAAPGLSHKTCDLWSLQHAGSFSCGTWTLSCGMWDLNPWPRISLGSLHWEHGVSATEPPGKSLYHFLKIIQISDIIWYLPFSLWFISLNMIISRFIHVVVHGIISFFLWLSNIPYCVCVCVCTYLTPSLSFHILMDIYLIIYY